MPIIEHVSVTREIYKFYIWTITQSEKEEKNVDELNYQVISIYWAELSEIKKNTVYNMPMIFFKRLC